MTTQDIHGKESPPLQVFPDQENAELELLKNDRFSWPLVIAFVVVVLAVIGFLAYHSRATNRRPALADRPSVEATETPAPLAPPLSPLEKAAKWQQENLAGTGFADLNIRSIEGHCFLVYPAVRGDSIQGIVAQYTRSARNEPADRAEVFRLAQERHAERYHRGLWPGDEVLLFLKPEGT